MADLILFKKQIENNHRAIEDTSLSIYLFIYLLFNCCLWWGGERDQVREQLERTWSLYNLGPGIYYRLANKDL